MILDQILNTLPEGNIEKITVGLHWTASLVEVNGEKRSGLSCTLMNEGHLHGIPDVPAAGELSGLSALEIANEIHSDSNIMKSIAMSVVNALIPRPIPPYFNVNAYDVLAEKGKNNEVSVVGHFPFTEKLRTEVRKLNILELNPQSGEYPASSAFHILPQSDVVAITSMSFVNGTFEGLITHCKPEAYILVLGPTTPLSPILFEYGVTMLCGSVIVDYDAMIDTLLQGGNFQQVHRKGIQFVARTRETL
ncbi:MAG: DUF364 domain-containing protein [Anaerolineales bacterium]|nr:DUF364 domain-containing protein [Anaerolineales bacterium]